MPMPRRIASLCLAVTLALPLNAKTLVVTTTESDSPPAGTLSLKQAIQTASDGDTIAFNLPGTGPFYLVAPTGGYPRITANNLTIDGLTQPGAKVNTNGIHAPNQAQLMIVIDSRNGNVTPMAYDPTNNKAGYGDNEFAILGVFNATNVVVRGLSLLAPPVDPDGGNNYYGISFARDSHGDAAGGQVSGCWIGVDPDGHSLTPITYAITAFRHRDSDGSHPLNIDRLTVGVSKASIHPRADFNVIVPTALPAILEGSGHRISGNFFNVLPDGLTEYNVALDTTNFSNNNQSQGMIQIGRSGNNTVIGTDGDGVHDADEGNVMAGTLPTSLNGYSHSLEFYGNNPGTNIVIAGNYIGVGIDGTTRFTNGVPVLNASGAASSYQIGSNLDGVSDSLEGNLFANNWPFDFLSSLVTAADPAGLSFFDDLSSTGFVSARGNSFINNFSFPIDPLKLDGASGIAVETLYASALEDVSVGVVPTLEPGSTVVFLKGTVPKAADGWGPTSIDLYAVDPEGITNGSFLGSSGLTNAWTQGKSYLGTFQVDGPNDLNPADDSFTFLVSSLAIQPGTWVTVTANYPAPTDGSVAGAPLAMTSPFSNPVPLLIPIDVLPIHLNIERVDSQAKITWLGLSFGYRLQSSPSLSHPNWEDVPNGTEQPVLLDLGAGPLFFRLKQ
jgi:hypothetical protein